MAVLGLTGNLASGKSTVLKLLKRKGAVAFDADKKIHRYYADKESEIYCKVSSLFPQAVHKGRIRRRKLANIVFIDNHKLKALEKIVHPFIIEELKQWIKSKKTKSGIYIAEAPLLFEKNLTAYFDQIILVKAGQKNIMQRAAKKYHLSRRQVLKRLSLYLPLKEKIKGAHFIINNNSNFSELKKEVDLLWEKIGKN